jgi:hypothetical protein
MNHLAEEVAAATLKRQGGDAEQLGHRPHVLGPIPPHHGHILLFKRVGRRSLRHRLFADGADSHVEKIRQHLIAVAMTGKLVDNLDETLLEIG